MKTKYFINYLPSYSILSLLITALLFLPAYFWNVANVESDCVIIRSFYLIILSASMAWCIILLGAVLHYMSKPLERIFIWLSFFFVWIITFGETFMIKFFHTRYAPFFFQLIDETNASESQGFVSAYVCNLKFLIIALFYICILLFGSICLHWLKKSNSCIHKKISLGFLLFTLFGYVFTVPEILGEDIQEGQKFPVGEDSFTYISKAYKGYKKAKEMCLICNEMHKDISVDSCDFTSPKIFLLIGESYNRHHSSLYGYTLDTNPCLSKLDSGLFVFADVVTSVNGTSNSFQNFFSLTSVDQDKTWAESPLFMSLFKTAGYHVTFYSNQFPKRIHLDSFDFDGGYYLDMPMVDSTCFDYRNNEVFPNDGLFLDQYEKERSMIDIGEHTLIIIHFIGQHMCPEDKYPQEYSYFTADSIKRKDLNEKQKTETAYYDNATRYNDFIVNRVIEMYKDTDAIFIYFADHGDEAHDFRDHRGRSFDISEGAPMMHNQMDIPFIIYVTPNYSEKHPEMVRRIAASVNRPFMTDDLPHLLLDIAGIHTEWFVPSRSVINENFNCKRKRMIGYSTKYDYDSICFSR